MPSGLEAIGRGDIVYVHHGRRGEPPRGTVVNAGPKWLGVRQGAHRPVRYSRETGRRQDGLPGQIEDLAVAYARQDRREALLQLTVLGILEVTDWWTLDQLRTLAIAARSIRAGLETQ